jgi:hypothetical protein
MTKNKKHDQKGGSVSHSFFLFCYNFEGSLSNKKEQGKCVYIERIMGETRVRNVEI